MRPALARMLSDQHENQSALDDDDDDSILEFAQWFNLQHE